MEFKSVGYETVMTFLAQTPQDEICVLAKSPEAMEKVLLDCKPMDHGSLTPDTQEAQEAAAYDSDKEDRAEEAIYGLIKKDPEAWEAVKAAVKKLGNNDGTYQFLQRYSCLDEFEPLLREENE